MSTTHSRAAKGGQVGANGEWYEGGKFIATTDHPKGKARKYTSTGRVEIEPWVWVQRIEGKRPLKERMGMEIFNHDNKTFRFNPAIRDNGGNAFPIEFINERKALIELWNAGERWIDA